MKFHSAFLHGNIRQPFEAVCAKCRRTIYFDLDPSGTPGFNGDWGDGHGDYGCEIDNGDDSEDGNGHVPTAIQYNQHLYPRPDRETLVGYADLEEKLIKSNSGEILGQITWIGDGWRDGSRTPIRVWGNDGVLFYGTISTGTSKCRLKARKHAGSVVIRPK